MAGVEPGVEGTGDSDEPGDNNVNQANAPEVRPEVEQPKLNGAGEQITVHVQEAQDGSSPVFFTLRTTTKFRKLMNAYCDTKNINPSTSVFVFDGKRLRAEQTPEDACYHK